MRWVITTVELKKTSTHCSAMWEYRKAKKINKKKRKKLFSSQLKPAQMTSFNFIQLRYILSISLQLIIWVIRFESLEAFQMFECLLFSAQLVENAYSHITDEEEKKACSQTTKSGLFSHDFVISLYVSVSRFPSSFLLLFSPFRSHTTHISLLVAPHSRSILSVSSSLKWFSVASPCSPRTRRSSHLSFVIHSHINRLASICDLCWW